MNAAQLRVIAIGMGYETELMMRPSERQYIDYFNNTRGGRAWRGKYDPENNPAQLLEIIEKLPFDQPSDKIGDGLWKADGIWKVQITFEGYVAESKSINEAVCNAAYEYFKGEL